MTRQSWIDIRNAIEKDIEDGVLEPGAKLPTEPELVSRYAAGRHSVRRAMSALAQDGWLSIEQGRGTFVLPRPRIEYSIGKRTRLRSNLTSQGIDVTSEFIGSEMLAAEGRPAQKLGLGPDDKMSVSRRITYADELPVAFGGLFHDARRFPDFAERRATLGSVSDVYKSFGISDYLRDSTTIHSRPARDDEAKRLRQHPGLPVMVVRSVDTLIDGTPIAFGEVIWSAARVNFNIAFED